MSTALGYVSNSVEVRCYNCAKKFDVLHVSYSVPEWILKIALEKEIIPPHAVVGTGPGLAALGIEVKVSTETKCSRCKAIDHRIFVV